MEVTIVENQAINLHEKLQYFFEKRNHDNSFCPVRDIMDRFGDKWSLLVILQLGYSGKSRFNELRSKIEGISQRMLTVTLRSLERDGILIRKIFAEVPPRVEYELTDMGKGLLLKIFDLTQWAFSNKDEIVSARSKYDNKNQID